MKNWQFPMERILDFFVKYLRKSDCRGDLRDAVGESRRKIHGKQH